MTMKVKELADNETNWSIIQTRIQTSKIKRFAENKTLHFECLTEF